MLCSCIIVELPIAAVHTFAQTPFRIEHLSVEQGLSQSSVWCIMQDRRNFLWFGTADGLNRFDGYSFHIFRHNPSDSNSLSNNTVWSLCEDRNGAIWVGTVGGVHRFDPLTQHFARLANHESFKGTYLEALAMSILEDHRGMLWFATVKGVAMLDPASGALKQFSADEIPVLASPPAYRILHEDDRGNVWLANGESLFRFDRNSKMVISVPAGLGEKISFLRSTRARDGSHWLVTQSHGLWRLPADSPFVPTRVMPHAANRLRDVCEDNDGRVWIGTAVQSLAYIEPTTGGWHSFTPTNAGEKNSRFEGVSAMIRDRSGMMWIGFDGAGLVKLNPYRNKFNHVLLPSSDARATGDNFFKSLIVDRRGEVWLGMYDQGVSVLNRSTGTVKRFRHAATNPQSLTSNTVFSLCEDRFENIWIGTDAGLNEYDRRTHRMKHHDLSRFASVNKRWNVVYALTEDASSAMWCGTGTHLLKFNRATNDFEMILSLAKLFPFPITPQITAIAPARDGTVWVGTLGGGMLQLNATGALERTYVHVKDSHNSLSHNAVKTILINDTSGVLWIGTEEGLNRFDPKLDQWRAFRVADGLPNDFIYGVLMDERRFLWISTNKGLSRMDTQDENHPRFRNYTPDDGLQSYEFNTNTYFKAPSGEMFFGGVNGFNTFFPDSVTENPHLPSIVITGFKKFDQPFNLGGDVGLRGLVELQYSESVFSFEFAALEFTNSRLNQYAYKMEGFDRDWIYCGTRREARYTNLDPGKYVFRVKGSNNDGIWNEQGASIRLLIVPPFWRTGWFLVLMSVVGVGAIAGVVRFVSTRKLHKQIEQLEREKEIQEERLKTRERIARDLHDDLASTVGSASFFIESVKRTLTQAPDQAREFLNKTGSLLSEAEESMSDIVWSVSPHHDTLESLLTRIRLTTSDICKANGVSYEVHFPHAPVQYTLTEEVRRGIYLIFKESLANAARHAEATLIRVAVTIEGDQFELRVEDNGKGFAATEKFEGTTKRGHGVRNMKKRAEEIVGELTIASEAGTGTTVVLKKRLAR